MKGAKSSMRVTNLRISLMVVLSNLWPKVIAVLKALVVPTSFASNLRAKVETWLPSDDIVLRRFSWHVACGTALLQKLTISSVVGTRLVGFAMTPTVIETALVLECSGLKTTLMELLLMVEGKIAVCTKEMGLCCLIFSK